MIQQEYLIEEECEIYYVVRRIHIFWEFEKGANEKLFAPSHIHQDLHLDGNYFRRFPPSILAP